MIGTALVVRDDSQPMPLAATTFERERDGVTQVPVVVGA
jgi:hypothetical protein